MIQVRDYQLTVTRDRDLQTLPISFSLLASIFELNVSKLLTDWPNPYKKVWLVSL